MTRYLLRFDDICPTMNWEVWNRVERILSAEMITPILAVIPDNADDMLRVSPPNGQFWDRVREWRQRGWTIGMHGNQHAFVTRDAGILQVNPYSEFAGIPKQEQRRKLSAGLRRLADEGIQSSLWIAPAHSFDRDTLDVLRELKFTHISDGFFPLPHVDDLGLMWIPQQLWSFRWRPFGVWTICFHINRWTEADLVAFEQNIKSFKARLSCFDAIAAEYSSRKKAAYDWPLGRAYLSVAGASHAVRSRLLTTIGDDVNRRSHNIDVTHYR